jgi:hypothetical protein
MPLPVSRFPGTPFLHKYTRWIVVICLVQFIFGRRFALAIDGGLMRPNAVATTNGRKSLPIRCESQSSMSFYSVSQSTSKTKSILGYIQSPRRTRDCRQRGVGAGSALCHLKGIKKTTTYHKTITSLFDASEDQSENNDPKTAGWNGEVVANTNDGRIRGCSIQPLDEDTSNTEWIITIDGIEADLGRFSEAIYKKFIQDAKQQRFQGFRPGTIPPHLEPTYRTFAMDECARETILEAMQQNNIRPFENCRSEMYLYEFCIPPLSTSKSSSKNKRPKKSGRKNRIIGESSDESAVAQKDPDIMPSVEPSWRTFATMKEAIDAGWRPGQSFSFSAKNVRGQKVKVGTPLGTTSIGANY